MSPRRPSDEAGDDAGARDEALRSLAAVDEVLREPQVAALTDTYPREVVVRAVRAVIERLRREIIAGGRQADSAALTPADLAPWVAKLVEAAVTPSLRPVINATGVVAHTNLGRSVLPPEALAAIAAVAGSYADLEVDLETGERASRQRHVVDALCALTGADDALVVNNNAAAVLLALTALCRDGEVIVSRGELVEIGDGFRIPDILAESGARLVEVGTTNRTYLRDVERAWTPDTRAVLRVHSSNYRIVGFTAQPAIDELVRFAHERGALVIDDLGSGALADLPLFADEPSARESLRLGRRPRDLQRRQAAGRARRPASCSARRGHRPPADAPAGARGAHRQAQPGGARRPAAPLPRPAAGGRARADAGAARPSRASATARRAARLCEADRRRRGRRRRSPAPARGALPVAEVASVAVALTPVDGDAGELAARAATRLACGGRLRPRRAGCCSTC